MQTQTKVVRSGFLNCAFTSEIMSLASVHLPCSCSSVTCSPSMELSGPMSPENLSLSCMNLESALSSTVGKERSLIVWPVGAVSKTTTLNCSDLHSFSTSANAIASSMPGRLNPMSSKRPAASMPAMLPILPSWLIISELCDLASTSIAQRFSKPSILVGSLPIFWLKASLRLCAGSVEIRRTDSLFCARSTASEQEVVVLPTPPFPPTKIHLSVSCSSTSFTVGSISSSIGSAISLSLSLSLGLSLVTW
mmetsp:Transcript_16211/g.63222  ORF Transcript_16211/g.63222 Transcript_16211/m.63222 type:complete len:250 (-) Transcript_16211:26-775(-)